MTISRFDKNSIDLIRAEVNKRLQSMSVEFGIDLNCGHCSYSSDEMNFKLEVKFSGVDLEKIKFEKNCMYFGLQKSDYKKTFIFQNEVYVIIGINMSSRKYPFSVKRSDGKGFKFTSILINKCLNNMVKNDIDSLI